MRIYPVYELCSRSQAAATNQHTNAQRRGEFCFIESGLFDLYNDTIPTLRTATQKAVSNARTTKNGAQEPIISGGVCSWSRKNLSLATKGRFFQRHNAKFYFITCKKLQNPPFFGFLGVESPHFDPERDLKPDCPCRGQPYANRQTAVKNGLFDSFRRV